jgi:hypothetical protein
LGSYLKHSNVKGSKITPIKGEYKMTKYQREATVAAAVAAVAAAVVLAVAFFGFTGTTSTTILTTITGSSTNFVLPREGGSTPLQHGLYPQNVTCTLATGICTLVIVNNSTIPLQLVGCAMTSIPSISTTSNSTTTTYSVVNGTAGSENMSIPSYSHQTVTCAVPPGLLENARVGGPADGTFTVKYAEAWYNIPAGTEDPLFFVGEWS